MNQFDIYVTGMHCRSCELKLEKNLRKLPNVAEVKADSSNGNVQIKYQGNPPNMDAVANCISDLGYALSETLPRKHEWFVSDWEIYAELFGITALIIMGYMLMTTHNWQFFQWFGGEMNLSYSVSFLVWLTAGVSSCMALIGGLVLGITARWNQLQEKTSAWSRFEPHIFFNLGRIVGFGIFWGALGYFGSLFQISNVYLGGVTLLSGIIMLLLGIRLTGISPRTSTLLPTLPKSLVDVTVLESASGRMGIMIAWALTFFLPCGFTLAVQIYAISTGSALIWALTLLFFALGTAPGLLGIGWLASALRWRWAKSFFRFSGVIVLLLWLYNISNGYTLVSLSHGWTLQNTSATHVSKNSPSESSVFQDSNVVIVRMTQDGDGYEPRLLTVPPNRNVRLIIEWNNPYSCSSQILMPRLGISKKLEAGENVIEFVSPASGEIKFSCSMGMYPGKISIN